MVLYPTIFKKRHRKNSTDWFAIENTSVELEKHSPKVDFLLVSNKMPVVYLHDY